MTEAPERQITLSECSICYDELKHRGGCAIVLCGSCEHAFCMNCVLEKPNGTECPCCRQPMTTGNWPNETEGEIRRRVAQASKEFEREKQILRDQGTCAHHKTENHKKLLSAKNTTILCQHHNRSQVTQYNNIQANCSTQPDILNTQRRLYKFLLPNRIMSNNQTSMQTLYSHRSLFISA